MSLRERTFSTVPGTTSIWHPSLNGARIFWAKRNGVTLNKVAITTQVNDQFSHGFGRIYVDPNNPFGEGEFITVLYET